MLISYAGKLKLLYIIKYLSENTDEEHSVSTPEIISYLEANGISAERKSIYTDIDALISFGFDIIKGKEGKNFGYKLISREFETAELKLLVNAIEASKFLSLKKSRELINKLGTLCSQHTAKTLKREVLVAGRVKSMNESIYRIIDTIHTAIGENKAISFYYTKYDLSKNKVLRHGGKKYVISPYLLTFDDENYYLIAFDHEEEKIKHYRVDKMQSVEALTESRKGSEEFGKISVPELSKQVFSMFGGETKKLTIRFKEQFIDAVLDRFGTDVPLIPEEGSFKIITDIKVSPTFFGWLSGFSDGAEILDPNDIREEYKAHIKKIADSF